MRMLFVVPHPLVPPDRGNKHHTLNLLRYASRDHDIDILGFDENSYSAGAPWEALEKMLPRVHVVRTFKRCEGWQLALARLRSLAAFQPHVLGRYWSTELATRLAGMPSDRYDVVCFDMFLVARYRQFCSDTATVLLATDAYSMMAERDARVVPSLIRKARRKLEATLQRHFENTVYPAFDSVACVSAVDAEWLHSGQPSIRVEVLPIPIEKTLEQVKPRVPGTEPRQRIVCWAGVGGDGIAIGVRQFIMQGWPRVRQAHPDAELVIWGKAPHPLLRGALRNPGVKHVAYVVDWVSTLRDTTIFLYPQRCGTGLQTKLQSAMALGLPCVVSPEAAGGLVLRHAENGFVCETPEEFAKYCCLLLEDESLQSRLGSKARADVWEAYSADVVGRQLMSILDRAVQRRRSLAGQCDASRSLFGGS